MDLRIILAITCGVIFVLVVIIVPPSVLLSPRTSQFRSTFRKKCQAFSETPQRCDDLLSLFEDAYVGLDSCDFPLDAYDQLFTKNPFTHSCGKTMFWSKTKGLVHEFTKKRDHFITLEDTLLGYIMNDQTWCGKKGSKETYTYLCDKCIINPETSFWRKASAEFADYACGDASVMLDRRTQEPFDPTSYFGAIEVKRLVHPRVVNLKVILVTRDNNLNCNRESLQLLQNMLDPNITYSCTPVSESRIRYCIERGLTTEACWS
ncbi:ADP-ribosyl cyclase/cyclic ADP-ribose hydrolase 1-like [Cololabis saira]|uniref:ADP-ribosyl cyclase/cyclic ADP-ribose hydrolase 1-like n=1 Tax=Cololabis saira TaxID=129043 RepID=UPI002AD56603|nr:ADP-ribosyl cyclase/cyclic ADP-ribose hydrolase 1-like [Cololabis saira]